MKTKIENYSFNKATKQITFSDYVTIRLDAILLITNVTSNIIIYNFADANKGGTVSGNILTLAYDTSSMANTDKLLIYYDDTTVNQGISATSLPLPTGASTSAKQDTGNTSLSSIDTKLTDVATQTTLALIKTKTDNLDTALSGIKTGTDKIVSNGATSTKQSDGSQKTQIVDGTGNVIGSTTNALDINIKSGNPTSITANAGTNLNTSALAIETGGNLASVKTNTDKLDVNLSTVAKDATLTGGTAKAIARGGAKGSTAAADVTSTASGSNHQVLDVAIYDGSGNLKDPTQIRTLTSSDNVTIANGTGASAVNIQDGGNTITVDGSVTATLSAETTKVIGVVRTADGSGNLLSSTTNALDVNLKSGVVTGSGTSTGAIRVELPTNGTGIVGLAAGTNGIGKLTANSGVTIGAVEIASSQTIGLAAGTNGIGKLTANDGVDIGDVTINNASGSAVYVRADQNGLTSERVTNTDGASTAFSNFGATASTYNYVRSISVYNSSATAGYVDFRDGTGGSVLWTLALPAGGGAVISSETPLFRTSVNTALAYDVSGALSTVYISISGFRSTT